MFKIISNSQLKHWQSANQHKWDSSIASICLRSWYNSWNGIPSSSWVWPAMLTQGISSGAAVQLPVQYSGIEEATKGHGQGQWRSLASLESWSADPRADHHPFDTSHLSPTSSPICGPTNHWRRRRYLTTTYSWSGTRRMLGTRPLPLPSSSPVREYWQATTELILEGHPQPTCSSAHLAVELSLAHLSSLWKQLREKHGNLSTHRQGCLIWIRWSGIECPKGQLNWTNHWPDYKPFELKLLAH